MWWAAAGVTAGAAADEQGDSGGDEHDGSTRIDARIIAKTSSPRMTPQHHACTPMFTASDTQRR
jgi:hypothetical protein